MQARTLNKMELGKNAQRKPPINSDMVLLDIVEKYAITKKVFTKYDSVAGECILCYNLFDRLKDVISKYNLNGEKLLSELNSVI